MITSLMRYENAFIKLDEGEHRLVGIDYLSQEKDLTERGVMNIKKIEFHVADSIALERRAMAGEAFKTLNNAEKICYADGYAAILFREGSYFLLINSNAFRKYAMKYGTDCSACGSPATQK